MINTLRALSALTIIIGLYFVITGGQVSGTLFGLILVFNGIDTLSNARNLKRLREYTDVQDGDRDRG